MSQAPTTEATKVEQRVRVTTHSHVMPAGPDYGPVPPQTTVAEAKDDRVGREAGESRDRS
jgi:hypothetical protein